MAGSPGDPSPLLFLLHYRQHTSRTASVRRQIDQTPIHLSTQPIPAAATRPGLLYGHITSLARQVPVGWTGGTRQHSNQHRKERDSSRDFHGVVRKRGLSPPVVHLDWISRQHLLPGLGRCTVFPTSDVLCFQPRVPKGALAECRVSGLYDRLLLV